MDQIVFATKKGNPATDSLLVAKGFGKSHKSVLRAIDNLECDAEFSRRNFAPSTYTDGRGKTQRSVIMSKDGFAFLVMGFTGKRAAQFKQGYIEQFNSMEMQLRSMSNDAPVINLLEHTQRGVQVANSKSVNNHQYMIGGVGSVIEYNRKNCQLHTGKRPNEIVKAAKAAGLPSKMRVSAKEVLRNTEPETACAMSLADQMVRCGADIEQAAAVTVQAKQVFAGMMKLGFKPSQLAA
ncbi:Rha family transcriptional regulator [Hymenobacter sp. 15J16-1T3B]|uniref:Rha family transcriptional regulator n=1 Tax=Hymenobacter sp. 15J16-1T3B TaxID=2886941 RepID=UPI001D0F9B41|nr:Rha family transcriptional regulator [Hymenobacter sp. 15J16-1T3B]MCC3159724.1 Rha family transcriptional regulator [Hymenobacter sp. 15J16-1T3B]